MTRQSGHDRRPRPSNPPGPMGRGGRPGSAGSQAAWGRSPRRLQGGAELRAELLAAARGYTFAQALMTGNAIGLFDALARPATTATLARRLKCSRRGIRALVDALMAMDLLGRRGERISLRPAAAELLRSTGRESIVNLLHHQQHLYTRWSGLETAVRSGRPTEARSAGLAARERFQQAMLEGARRAIPEVLALLDLRACESFLDVGGGLGAYAAALVRRWPHLDGTLLEQPPVARLARRYLRAEGLAERIAVIAGDARRDPLGGSYDLVLFSNVLHIYSRRECVAILRRAVRALAPRGTILIKDFFLRRDRRGPLRAGLFALNMLIATETGAVLSEAELDAVLRSAGLRRIATRAIGEASLLVAAAPPGKPGARPEAMPCLRASPC
ncbi:MAG: methyltransferase domain-containing protein [Candidatus Eisenbacteria sp.]|nr:methyltransferase domain-containing protein [Candidatus Eisenbacteria bacterium]